MDHQYPTVAKIPVLDTGKFEQWQFRIQKYLQHEHYALWEVIEFGDSYKVPTNTNPDNTTTRKDDKQSRRTVTITTKDMQRKKNDVNPRTTLLLSLPDEHQLRFSKYKTAEELWAAILKTFGGNEATKKRKKNLLKQQYGNFKAKGSKTLEQTFNRLQVIEPDNSLSMEDEHLDTIPATESDEFIKFSVENLIPIPSESEGIPDHMCDVPSIDNSPPLDVSKDQIKDFSESNEEFSLTDDDSFSFDNIDYVEASPPDSELVSSEVMEIITPEVDAFLAVEDEPTSSQFPTSYLDPEGFLSDDHSFDFKTKSSSTSLNSLLEETNNFNNSLPAFTTFSKVLFDAECQSDSSDDQSCFDEDVLEKIVLKPLCEEEIIPMKSLRTHDSSLPISSKINSFLDEFAGELTFEAFLNVAGFDKSKVECFNCHKMGHFTRECRAPRSQERGRKENYRQGSKAEEKTSKALMAIDGVGWDWSYMANEGEDHAL
nr:hypothetical protein [Tanacetum cinerariifolium]